MTELWQMSGLDLGRAIASREMSAVEVLDAIVARVEAVNPPVSRPLDPFFTYPFNQTGQPAASVPVGFTDDGLPIGLQIVGRRFAEKTVLRASTCFEAVRPWADRWPAL